MPFDSPYPPVAIPDTDMWSFLFERKAKDFTDSKTIFTDSETGRRYTYGDLRSTSLAFGGALQAAWDWQRGDVLAFYTPNSIDTPAVTLGLLWAGGVASPANPLYTEPELAFQLRDSGAKALVTQLPFLATARKAAAAAGIGEDRILLLGDARDPTGSFLHFRDLPCAPGVVRRAPRIDAQTDLGFLVYSSGTTGLPKGVCLTHRNIVANTLQLGAIDGVHYRPYGGLDGLGDKGLGLTPFFHIYGLTCCVFATIYFGWELVSMARFDIERACQIIETHGITFAYVPPPVVLALSKHPAVSKYDLTSLRMLHSGAAPLTPDLALALWDRLRIPVKQAYGLSETSPAATMQQPDDWAKFIGSTGRLVPNMRAKLVDPDTEQEVTAFGVPGELWLQGPNVFQGYLNLPDNTRATMSPDGYFKTGDIFVRDRHGNLTCVDRLKELIKYKGFQVPPAELEGILLGHADIADAGVIGVEDRAQATEVPRAYVVMKPGVATDAAKANEIAAWMASLTAPHKKLRGGVRFVSEIPKSPSGKILRRVLRDQARAEDKPASKL